jgi:hypothetical protein
MWNQSQNKSEAQSDSRPFLAPSTPDIPRYKSSTSGITRPVTASVPSVSSVHFLVHPEMPEVQQLAADLNWTARGFTILTVPWCEMHWTTDGWKTSHILRSTDVPLPSDERQLLLAERQRGHGGRVRSARRHRLPPTRRTRLAPARPPTCGSTATGSTTASARGNSEAVSGASPAQRRPRSHRCAARGPRRCPARRCTRRPPAPHFVCGQAAASGSEPRHQSLPVGRKGRPPPTALPWAGINCAGPTAPRVRDAMRAAA